MSGLTAAISALELGASVAVVEKGPGLGGSMALSNGLIWTFKDKQQLRREIPFGDGALQDMIIEELAPSLDWLESQGVQLEPAVKFQRYGWGRQSNPAQMLPALVDKLHALGGHTFTKTALDTLIVKEGRVAGAHTYADATSRSFHAAATIVATGGFQGNPELVERFITRNAHHMYLRSNPFSTGDGFVAAMDIGAAATDLLHTFYGHALVAPPARFNQLEFQAMSQKHGAWSVAINLDGKRFTDESQGTGEEDLNFHIAQQRHATAIYIVDAKIANMEWPDSPPARAAIGRARSAGGPVLEAETLQELAAGMTAWGVPENQVLATLEEYNAAVSRGEGATLVPARKKTQLPLVVGPFTAVMVKAALTYSCGGLKADLDMRVIRRSNSVSTFRHMRADVDDIRVNTIRDLFVAGCDMGGVSNWGYMGGLSQALVSGRIAGRSAGAAAISGRAG